MKKVLFNLINRSEKPDDIQIILYQKNTAHRSEFVVAWKVIEHFGRGGTHPFAFEMAMEIAASDAFGNFTQRLPADHGQSFHIVRDATGDVIHHDKRVAQHGQIDLHNELSNGSIMAHLYRSGLIVAQEGMIGPGKKGTFELRPSFYVGLVQGAIEGEIVNSSMIDLETQIEVLGLSSADIVLSGGGQLPLHFRIENINSESVAI